MVEGRKAEVNINPGDKWRFDYGTGNMNNKLCHIRAVVDDNQIVYRAWSKREQMWIYHIDHLYFWELVYSDGHLKKV